MESIDIAAVCFLADLVAGFLDSMRAGRAPSHPALLWAGLGSMETLV